MFLFLPLTRIILLLGLSFICLNAFSQEAALTFANSNKDSLEQKEVSIPELVITAEKNPFSQLSQLDVQLRPIQSSQDVLRAVPGLFIAQHAGGGKAEQIFLRGFDIDHGTDIALSVDGLPVNMVSHAHGQGYADLHFLIPELISRVEYGKGPSDAEKGNFATAGYVDFFTPRRLKNNSVKLSAGQYDSYRGLLMTNLFTEESSQQAYIAADYSISQGYFEAAQNFNRLNLFGKYSSMLGKNTSLQASAAFFRSGWDASGQIPQRAIEQGLISRWGAIDSTEGGNTQRAHAEAKITHLLSSNSSLSLQAYLIRYDFSLFSNFTFFLRDSVNGDQIHQSESRWISGGKLAYTHQKKTPWGDLQTTAGITVRNDAVRDNFLAYTFQRDSVLDYVALGDVQELNMAAFWEESIRFSPRWELTAGLRYDLFRMDYLNQLESQQPTQNQLQGQVNPKLKLRFIASEKMSLFVHSGTGFHSNDTRLFVSDRSRDFLPRAFGLDVGLIAKPWKNVFIQAIAWGLDLEQEFVYVGDEGIVEAGGRTRRQGLEVSARWQPFSWLYADADVTWTLGRARDEAPDMAYIPLAPGLTATGGLSAEITPDLRLGIRYRQLADRPANEDYSLVAEGYQLVDLLVNYRWKRFEWGLNIENVFNTEWKEAQFETTSRLSGESQPVSEIHFTPGSPFFARLSMQINF